MVQLELMEINFVYVGFVRVEWVEIVFVELFLVYKFDVQFECFVCCFEEFGFRDVEYGVEIDDVWDCCFIDVNCVDLF